ncbi:MAG: xanthine dehydrogenase family protein molybdopterin-binding subunit [Meiothermus sp.]|nr:xanthine dehydrogenase family protein molybdopterin-binding subunit [Meiothermus sp.]
MMHDKKPDRKVLGKGRKLIDGLEKVTGRARYAADVGPSGMLHARPLLSVYAHARIRGMDKTAALKVPGVVAVLSGEDLQFAQPAGRPGALLARGHTVFAGQPVAVVVARTEAAASDAAALLEIDYEPLEGATDPLKALEADAPLVWPAGLGAGSDMASLHGGSDEGGSGQGGSNVINRRTWQRGDVAAGFAGAAMVYEQTYRSAWVHQTYLEPHAVVAEPDGRGGVTLHTSTQGQYAVRGEVAKALGLPPRSVHVVPMTVGGAFGAKYGILDPLVAAVALKVGRPVRMVLTRSEDFQTTMPGPGNQIRIKTGADAAGNIVAIQAEVVLESGAFPFGFAGIFAMALGGMYRCANLETTITEVYTHKPGGGAYRAPGVPHVLFALESNIDEMARRLGMDELEFRLQNAVEAGDLNGVGVPWPKIGLKQCLEAVRAHPVWQNRNAAPNEGVGLAIGGWPGAFSPAGALCRVEPDGTARLHVGSVDISGVHSSLVLITAETLGIRPEQVELVQGTTDTGPHAPASGGSQVTISVSGAVLEASEGVRVQLLKLAGDHFEVHPDDLELEDGYVRVKGVPEKAVSLGELATMAQRRPGGPGPVQAEGRAALKAGAPGFTAHLVRLRVDPDSGQVTLLDYVNAQDVGFALNPTLVEGQMHGGSVQGLGIGLFEALRFDPEGGHLSPNFLEYALPRAVDVPPIQTLLLENPSEHGPFGARIVGEPPITAGAAAVANAIRAAVGVRMTELPIRPEDVWRAMARL